MTTAIDAAVSGALATLAAANGRSVSYSRAANSVTLTAIPGQSEHEMIDGEGFPTTVQSRTYDIDPDDLVLNGSEVLPQRGDRIVETLDATSETFEVMPTEGIPPYEWLDAGRQILRIHTKQVG